MRSRYYLRSLTEGAMCHHLPPCWNLPMCRDNSCLKDKIVQWNCQSVNGKKDELLQLAAEVRPMVLAVQETMLPKNHCFRLPSYSFHTKVVSFNRRHHGGVGLFIHESVPTQDPIQLNNPLQAIAVQIFLKQKLALCSFIIII